MSEYIIHNIALKIAHPKFDFDGIEEPDKPLQSFPDYYLGKYYIGPKGSELNINRKKRGGGDEHIPNCVLRNDNGIALIRVHNKEDITLYNLPDNTGDDIKDCIGTPTQNYPYSYVVVDYRDGKCQIALEKSSVWDSKTTTIRNGLEKFFQDKMQNHGIEVSVKERTQATEFSRFIDRRTIDYGDVIESFTFEYPNNKRNPTARIPAELTSQIDQLSNILEFYGAISGSTTVNLGEDARNDKLKQLSTVVTMCCDNSFNLIVKLRDYGEYTCNENIVAKYPMNDIVISNYKDFETPELKNGDFDLESWLDDVFEKTKNGQYEEKIPTKPTK